MIMWIRKKLARLLHPPREVHAVRAGNWKDPNTWKDGWIPRSKDSVVTNGYTIRVNTPQACHNVKGAGITVNSHRGHLTVNGHLDV